MYGMTGKLTAHTDQRRALVEILLNAAKVVSKLQGCRMYAVAEDMADPDAVWVVEIWDDKNAHDQSLKNEAVHALIAQGMPLISGSSGGGELNLIGGFGLPGLLD